MSTGIVIGALAGAVCLGVILDQIYKWYNRRNNKRKEAKAAGAAQQEEQQEEITYRDNRFEIA